MWGAWLYGQGLSEEEQEEVTAPVTKAEGGFLLIMFIEAVSSRGVRQSDLESLVARDGFWRSHGQGESRMSSAPLWFTAATVQSTQGKCAAAIN